MSIELLPPNPRKPCVECKKYFSKLHLCRDGKRRCYHCKSKIITNKWYITPEKRRENNKKIGKFSLSDQEKDILHDQFVRQGMNSENAWRKVHKHEFLLRMMRGRIRGWETMRKNKELKQRKEKDESKKKLLGGLK